MTLCDSESYGVAKSKRFDMVLPVIKWTILQVVGYEGSVQLSVSLEVRTLRPGGSIMEHSLISGDGSGTGVVLGREEKHTSGTTRV